MVLNEFEIKEKSRVKHMKKILMVVLLAVASAATVSAQSAAKKLAADKTQLSLADARGKIDKAIESPAVMRELMKRLSAEDQRQFLADVNKAIGNMPASIEEKTAKFLHINHAAMTEAKKGNATALLAEVFATVSPEALTVINERFADDLVNRAANPNVTYTDAQYTELAVEAMRKINERTDETDNGSTRSAFAILMFIRASNGTPADLADKLIETLKNEEARELAKKEWIPSALGKDGRETGYEPLLASADAGRRPDFEQVLVIAGPQLLDSILMDLSGKNTDRMSFPRTRTPVLDAVENPLVRQIPTLTDEPFGSSSGVPGGGNPAARRVWPTPTPAPTPTPVPPGPYWLENMGR